MNIKNRPQFLHFIIFIHNHYEEYLEMFDNGEIEENPVTNNKLDIYEFSKLYLEYMRD